MFAGYSGTVPESGMMGFPWGEKALFQSSIPHPAEKNREISWRERMRRTCLAGRSHEDSNRNPPLGTVISNLAPLPYSPVSVMVMSVMARISRER